MRILLIEDSARLAALMSGGLARRGFACDTAMDLMAAQSAFDTDSYDAIILDLGLPDGDGVDWLMRQRARGRMEPALILTARDALADRVSGLDAGADDYVVKPVEVDELAARIRALLRRPGPRAETRLLCGALTFDAAARTARHGDEAIDLSRRECDLLELLMRKSGTVVRRQEIENALYSFAEPVTPNAVEANVSRLRRKLEEAGAIGLLHTVRGVGYMLRPPGP